MSLSMENVDTNRPLMFYLVFLLISRCNLLYEMYEDIFNLDPVLTSKVVDYLMYELKDDVYV